MGIVHMYDSKGSMKSKRFIPVENGTDVNVEDLRRALRMMKDSNHSKMPVHLCVMEKLLEAYALLHGVKETEDLRRTVG